MPRNPTAVQTPGETPTAPAAGQPAGDAFQAVATDLTGSEPAADSNDVDELRALVKRQAEQMSAMMAAVTQLQANQSLQVPTPKQSQEWDPLESTCRHASLSIL